MIFYNLCADEVSLLNKEQSKIIEIEKLKIINERDVAKHNWISPWSIRSSINKNSSVSDAKSTTKKVSIGFSQDIFKSGGIGFLIDYGDKKYTYNLLNIDDGYMQLVHEIYDDVLEIKKLELQIKQNTLSLENIDIEIYIKKLQYENGKLDLVELNKALIQKNNTQKEKISLKNSLKNKMEDLSKLTEIKHGEIEVLDFKEIQKEQFLKYSTALNLEDAKEDMLLKSYKKEKSDYMPSVSLSGEYGYSQSDYDTLDAKAQGDYYSMGLSLLIPLDYFQNSKTGISKKEYLMQQEQKKITKKEIDAEYEKSMNQIDIYKEHNEILKNNMKLYDELIEISSLKVKAGYASEYDLDILKNTSKSDEVQMQINSIDIKRQWAMLYFKMVR